MRVLLVLALGLATWSAVIGADDHGDSPLAATLVDVGAAPIDACIDPVGDLDYFFWNAVAGRTYRLLTSHLSQDMDTLLYLFSSDGRTILRVDDNSATGGASQIEWTADESGVVFAMVRHARATTGTGCYRFSIAMLQVDDHGNDALTATPLSVGTARAGFLETPSDVDVFLFAAERGYAYRVGIERTSERGTIAVRWLDADGTTRLAEGEVGEAPLELAWTAPSSGSRFLELGAAGDNETAAGYEVLISASGYGDDHGSTAAAASDLNARGPLIEGRIEVNEDEDWFRFTAKQNGEYRLILTPLDGAALRLSLVGADGTTLVDRQGAAGGSLEVDWEAPNEGTYYAAVRGTAGTYTLRLDTTLQLAILGHLNPQGYSLDVKTDGETAYLVVGTKGLLVVDASDPTQPLEVGSNSTRGYAQSVTLAGTTALVANRGDGVTLLDISDPMRPTEVGRVDTPGSAQAIAVSEGYAFVADQRGGLQVLDVQRPAAPAIVGALETGGFAQAIALSNRRAYVALGDSGLEIVDISDPKNPLRTSQISLLGGATDVVVVDGIAYVAAGYRGVRVLDVSDPNSPREVSFFSTTGEAVGLALDPDHETLCVAERAEGLSVYSLADPSSPKRVAQIDTPGEALRVAVDGDRAYVACREAGLYVIALVP
ncbi:MAG: hypothetical protein AB1778_09215 [Candidatus Bipolaricaulota bacterium]